MKNLIYIIMLQMLLTPLYGQFEEPEVDVKQFMMGVIGVTQNQQITHTITAYGTVWEWVDNDGFLISCDQDLFGSDFITTGNSDTSYSALLFWGGWTWKWADPNSSYPFWGFGLYKVTNDYDNNYFYLDTRESKYGSSTPSPDFWILYKKDVGYEYKYASGSWEQITHNSIVRIWELQGRQYHTPNTFEDYWENALVLVDNGSNNPRLIFGPYPEDDFSIDYYKIYKKLESDNNFSVLTTTSSTSYIDIDEEIIYGPAQQNETVAYYKISAYGSPRGQGSSETGFTNTESSRVKGDPPAKRHFGNNILVPETSEIISSFPNPFNPGTIIDYRISEKGNVSLIIYNALGKEVAEIVNEVKEAGNYTAYFNADNLSSGLYIAVLNTSSQISTQKLLLIK